MKILIVEDEEAIALGLQFNPASPLTTADFQELHDLIWGELQIPFADSFFLVNHNDALPDQVSVETHRSLNWTLAEKKQYQFYSPGQVLIFHKPTRDFARND